MKDLKEVFKTNIYRCLCCHATTKEADTVMVTFAKPKPGEGIIACFQRIIEAGYYYGMHVINGRGYKFLIGRKRIVKTDSLPEDPFVVLAFITQRFKAVDESKRLIEAIEGTDEGFTIQIVHL